MPELPDVEGFRRYLALHGAGRRIKDVEVLDAGVLRNVSGAELRRELRGCRFGEPCRHGKWLLTRTDGPWLAIHFGMTGSLHWSASAEDRHRHDRVVFVLDRGELRYRDLRKLRGLWLLHSEEGVQRLLANQGPDALSVSRVELSRRLSSRVRGLKSALMDQRLIAGLGNLLVDEMLWHAGLAPQRDTKSLGPADLGTLYREMRSVLRQSIPEGCVPSKPRWITGHRDADRRCPRCHQSLRRQTVAGRTTYWCSRCQH